MATTAKRSRATIVKHDSVKGIQSLLQALPEKTKDDLSLKEAVTLLQEPLQEALAKGYTYPDLATLLTNTGIPISSATLKNYVPTGKRSGKGRAKPTKARRQAVTAVAPEGQLASPVTAEAIATPPITSKPTTETSTKRRGKGKAAATETAATDAAIAPAPVATTPTKQRGQRTGRQAKATTETDPPETAAKPTSRAGKSAKASTRKKPNTTSAAKQITPTRTQSSKTRKPKAADA